MMISPLIIDKDVEKLLNKMNAEFEPELVKVLPDLTASPDSCYYNVQDRIERHGGKIHYGWVIWKTDMLCEAEHHAVWEDDNGRLLCVTPRELFVDTIMFVPDNDKVYSGISIDNVRLNITGNLIIDDFIAICEINTKLWALGTRESRMELHMPDYVLMQIERNKQILHNIQLYYLNGGTRNSACFCSSGKRYGQCHGYNLVGRGKTEFNAVFSHHQRVSNK